MAGYQPAARPPRRIRQNLPEEEREITVGLLKTVGTVAGILTEAEFEQQKARILSGNGREHR